MLFHVTPLSAWLTEREAPDQGSVMGQEEAPPWVPSEADALQLANTRFRDHTEAVVALVVDDQVVDPAGPMGQSGVVEVRYLRRDPTGSYVALERRPPLADALDLYPHPEGGWYRETWVSSVEVAPDGYEGTRATATAIYFLLPSGSASCWHMLRSDEIWLWQRGGALELRLGGSGDVPVETDVVVLGNELESGQVLQAVVPGGTWQSAQPIGDTEVLVSTIVSPGFHFADFRAL